MEATKYLKLLQKHSPDSLETHLLSFEVNMRKQKILLAFQVIHHPNGFRGFDKTVKSSSVGMTILFTKISYVFYLQLVQGKLLLQLIAM